MSPRPGTITAIQVILYIRATLGVLSLLAVLTGWGPTSGSEVWRVTWDTAVFDVVPELQAEGYPGLYTGAFVSSLMAVVELIAFEFYVASTLGRGGRRTRLLVRITVVFCCVGAALALFSGGDFAPLLILMIVVLVLNESASAKDWYQETEYPAPRPGAV